MKVKGYMYPQMKKPVGMLLCNYNVRTTVCLPLFADFENKSVSLPSVNHISDVIAMGICTLALYS
jgi:hypothetical protein